MKKYDVQFNVGRCKYLVNYHNGISKHNDGSEFFDIATFTNKKKFEVFIESLECNGYVKRN